MNINSTIICDLYDNKNIKFELIKYLLENRDFDLYCKWDNRIDESYYIEYNNDKKNIYTIPYGIFHNLPSLLGKNCTLNIDLFLNEIKMLESLGINTNLIKLDPLILSKNEKKPIKDDNRLTRFLFNKKLKGNLFCESNGSIKNNMLPYNACNLGFPFQKISRIISFYKLYDIDSNKKIIDEDKEILDSINVNINWLNLNVLIDKINLSSCSHIIFLDENFNLSYYKLFLYNDTVIFKKLEDFKMFLCMNLRKNCEYLKEIHFSSNKK